MQKSPYFQSNGSSAGVLPAGYLQAATSAGQSIGQGLANVGQDLSAGIQKYYQNEKMRQGLIGSNAGALQDPNMLQNIQKYDPKLVDRLQNNKDTLDDHLKLSGFIQGQRAQQQIATQQAAAAQEARIRENQIALGATAAKFASTEAQQKIDIGNQGLALGGQQLTAATNQNKTLAAISAANVAANQPGQENVAPTKRLADYINTVSANGGQVSTQDLETKKAEFGVPKNVKIDVQSVFDEQGNYVGRSIKYNGVPSDFIPNPFNNPAMIEKAIRLGNETVFAPTTNEATKFRNSLDLHKNMVQQADQIEQLIKDYPTKIGLPRTEANAQMKTLIGAFRNNVISGLDSKRISPEVEKIITSITGSPEDMFSKNSNTQKQIRTIINLNAQGLANTVATYSNNAARINKNTFGYRPIDSTISKNNNSSVRTFDTSGKEITNNQ
jgi:hypothetical protein